ncbi:YxeA family protein [Paenibacillus cellulositrophicus]|uniref:YxeA family protein n=1 Tax=Paenibacillus cellulositrophicus TaxID=562959 RepID=UPI00203EDB9D|nr:YxeA family protein [Paenibacillus cellulositrophicus]MCM3002011.1 YxeA family protein [Paenibacillus cellulositrophicus]
MKKGIIALAVVLVGLVGIVVFFQNMNLKRLGAQQYYVQITQDGKRMEEKLDNGEKVVHYEYSMKGFDSNGKEKSLTFTAFKELRNEAYLRIYVKGDKVSSYQEVQSAELPKEAGRKLETVVN